MAAAWIDSATFSRLDVHSQRAISAMASIPVLFAAGAQKFGDAWRWTKGDSPIRDIGQRGMWRSADKQVDLEFVGGFAAFDAAYKKGNLAGYMQAAVQAASPADLSRLRRQAGQALLVACEGMRLSMHKDHIEPAELDTAFKAITAFNPGEKELAALRKFVPEPNRRAINAFVASFMDLMASVQSGAVESDQQYLGKDDVLKTFYGLSANLLGLDHDQMTKTLMEYRSDSFENVSRGLIRRFSTFFNQLCNGDKRFND
ncbi:MAG: hypothetical protein Q7U14_11695 [Lacisediminimonas sp.]|nr:hypothetical protein [Lacisediminimonas sp.]